MSCSDDLNKKKITKNSLKLPKDSDEVEVEKPSINEKLINKLRDACNSRCLLAKQVLHGEWIGVPKCPEDRLLNNGISKHMSFLTFLQKSVCWDPISTKRTVIKFYSNLHENLTKLSDYNGKTGLNCKVDAWLR